MSVLQTKFLNRFSDHTSRNVMASWASCGKLFGGRCGMYLVFVRFLGVRFLVWGDGMWAKVVGFSISTF